ncbi:MAG: FliA/WhiG family RNA polymerase sigma factor [Pseudomonadota bacterium]|nr:FliA/WhiG family RNA polymerase sigma factor [Pseudomonadota bacterium]
MELPLDRDAQIINFLSVVRVIAIRVARVFPSSLEVDDLINVGTIGLIEAVDRFEAHRGVPFRAFAEVRVRGAMVDAIRKTDWVPRQVRRRGHVVEDARRTLRNRLGRAPTRDELAACLEITPEVLDELVGATAPRSLVSMDAQTSSDTQTTVADTVADDEPLVLERWIEGEDRGAVAEAIELLPDDEREVVVLYYERGLKYREIGARMGICESRVCQLRSKAVERLRKRVQLRASLAG